MPLPDNLERLKHISIDTLGLSNSTSALLKWHGIINILDCIGLFYTTVRFRDNRWPWPRLITCLFGEVKPALIAAGYWELVLDADMWRALDEHKYSISNRRFIQWQGGDQNLYEIPLEQLDLSELPTEVRRSFKSIGACIDYFLYRLSGNARLWRDLGKVFDRPAHRPFDFHEYMLGVIQPRLKVLGYWNFVEDYIDDFIEESRSQLDRERLRRGQLRTGDHNAAGQP